MPTGMVLFLIYEMLLGKCCFNIICHPRMPKHHLSLHLDRNYLTWTCSNHPHFLETINAFERCALKVYTSLILVIEKLYSNDQYYTVLTINCTRNNTHKHTHYCSSVAWILILSSNTNTSSAVCYEYLPLMLPTVYIILLF